MFRVKGGVALAVVGVVASLVLASRMNMRELEAMAIVVAIGTGYYLLTRRTSI
jgi:EamA domain-containing membrane protein RarD